MQNIFRCFSPVPVVGVLLLAQLACVPAAQARTGCPETQNNDASLSQVIYFADWSRLRHRAERGDADALFQLGNLHYAPPDGSGIPQSYRKAFELFWAAAQRGHATAQHNVGVMYANGDYVPASVVEAYAWFLLSASNGDKAGKRRREQFHDQLGELQRRDAEARYRALLDMVRGARQSKDYAPPPLQPGAPVASSDDSAARR